MDNTDRTELLCIGNAVVDAFAPADPAWLEMHHIAAGAQHIEMEKARQMLDSLRSADAVLSSGGAVANVAKIAAMMGVRTAFAGSSGRDELAGFFEDELKQAGVLPFVKRTEGETGLCLVLDAGGENRIAASPGASLNFDEHDVPEALIAAADAVVLDGYMLDRKALVHKVLQLASRHGIPIALDAASVFQVKEKTEAILHYSRNYPMIVFMNADESITFYNTIRKGDSNADAMSEREKTDFILREICPALKGMTEGDIFPVLVIKLGGKGAVVLAGGNIHRAGTFAIKPKNTVGAGDAFCAAFVCAWIRGRPIRECAWLGNKVAKKLLAVPGTSIKKEKFASLAKLLKK